VTTQISTIELNPELVNMAYEMGLNVQKTCENGLKEAIKRLRGVNFDFNSVRNAEAAGSNPARSTTSKFAPNCGKASVVSGFIPCSRLIASFKETTLICRNRQKQLDFVNLNKKGCANLLSKVIKKVFKNSPKQTKKICK